MHLPALLTSLAVVLLMAHKSLAWDFSSYFEEPESVVDDGAESLNRSILLLHDDLAALARGEIAHDDPEDTFTAQPGDEKRKKAIERFHEIVEHCKDTAPMSRKLQKKIYKGNFTTNEESEKCFFACFLQTINLFGSDDITEDDQDEIITYAIGEEGLKKFKAECANATDGATTKCDKAYKYLMCYVGVRRGIKNPTTVPTRATKTTTKKKPPTKKPAKPMIEWRK